MGELENRSCLLGNVTEYSARVYPQVERLLARVAVPDRKQNILNQSIHLFFCVLVYSLFSLLLPPPPPPLFLLYLKFESFFILFKGGRRFFSTSETFALKKNPLLITWVGRTQTDKLEAQGPNPGPSCLRVFKIVQSIAQV